MSMKTKSKISSKDEDPLPPPRAVTPAAREAWSDLLRRRVNGSAKRSRNQGLRRPRAAVQPIEIGVAYDLKSEVEALVKRVRGDEPLPDDVLEEYDSEATVEAIEGALRRAGYRTRRLGSGRSLIGAMMETPCGLVFNIAEGWGSRSREAHVPSVLEMLGVPYTHSDPLTLALTLDKGLAKRVVASCGVRTPAFEVVDSLEDLRKLDLRFPVIAKPLFEGSSMGIRKSSRVSDPEALDALMRQLLADYREPVLVEEFCAGPELTVGILGTGRDARVFGSMEIVPRRGDLSEFVYSLEVKRNYQEEVEYHAPPRVDAEAIADAESTALTAYRALGCRDVGRVDVRFGDDGKARFLEVNPLPGLSPITSDLAIMLRGYGISYDELIGRIVEKARQRLGI